MTPAPDFTTSGRAELESAHSASAAYNATAKDYDRLVTDAPRALLHSVYGTVVTPGDHVVDAGCGTGIDAAVLAGLGARVTGVDISEGMLEVARRRPMPAGADVRFIQGDISNLPELIPGSADVVVSAFAAVNTGVDLSTLGATLHGLLRQDGAVVLHVLTPGGLFDRAGHLSRGRVELAVLGRRELKQHRRVGGAPVEHTLVRPDHLFREYFASRFRLVDLLQTGALTPGEGPTRAPARLAAFLHRVDHYAARWPLVRNYGRFGILVLRAR